MKKYRYLLLFFLSTPLALFSQEENTPPQIIRHCLTFDVGLGYSSIFNNSTFGKNKGFIGGNLQVGYEWQNNNFLLHTGIELASINNKAKINNISRTVPYPAIYPNMTEHFDIKKNTELEILGSLNIPIMAGCQFLNDFYFLAGAKVGLPLWHKTTNKFSVSPALQDPTLIGLIDYAPAHNIEPFNVKQNENWKSNFNVFASAEIGMMLNSYFKKNKKSPVSKSRNKKKPLPRFYRVALFADFGLLSCTKEKMDYEPQITPPNSVVLNPFINTGKKANPFLIGVKFAMQLQLNRPKKVIPPASTIEITIKDAETAKPLAATLMIKNLATGREQKASVSTKGMLRRSSPIGNFSVAASADNYFPDTMGYSISQPGDNVSLDFNLKPIPKPEPPKPIIFNNEVIEKGKTITLDERFLRFATGQIQVLEESKPALNALYLLLNENPEINIRITGHTDDVGSNEDNLKLSIGRAQSVKQELINKGINPDRIQVEGKGEEEPIETNKTASGRAKNRRVEITIL